MAARTPRLVGGGKPPHSKAAASRSTPIVRYLSPADAGSIHERIFHPAGSRVLSISCRLRRL